MINPFGLLHHHKVQVKTSFNHWIAEPYRKAKELTCEYMAKNWKVVLTFALAWALIVVGMGVMYDFGITARNLTIGMGIGLAVGGAVAIIVVKSVKGPDIEDKNLPASEVEKYSLWGLVNLGFYSLDENGTRVIVVSVLVTILLTYIPIFPLATGVVVGIVGMNYLVTQIGFVKFVNHQARGGPAPSRQEIHEAVRLRRETVANEVKQ